MATILSLTALTAMNLQLEEAWGTNQRSIEQSELRAEALAKQLAVQQNLGNQVVATLTNPTKDRDVRVLWYDFCNSTVADCDSDDYCGDLTAAEKGMANKDYAITQCVNDKFAAKEDTFAGSSMDFNDYVRKTQADTIVKLINKLDAKYALALHANAGFNRGGFYSINGTTGVSEVPTADYSNMGLITQMIIDAKRSKIQNPFIIDSGNLLKTYLNAGFNGANGEGKGEAARANFYDVTFDIDGLVEAGAATANSTFLVSPYAIVFVNKTYYGNTAPIEVQPNKFTYSIRIPRFGVTVDVIHQKVCANLKKNRWDHTFYYTVHYDFLTNPFGCADANGKIVTGIVEYVKV